MTIRNLRSAVAGIQQNRRIRAIALEVINGRATVKLAGSSQLLYGLSITGGTIVAGQEVYVDYTTGNPVVHSYQEDSPSVSLATRTKVREIIKDPDVPYSNEFTEAPIDGILYGRQNACWVEITTTGSLNDLLDVNTGSATDGQALVYDADTGLWGPGTVTSGSSAGVEEAPIDGKQYARKDGDWVEVTSSGTSGSATQSTVIAKIDSHLTSGSAGDSEIVFANIPEGYSNLIIKLHGRGTNASTEADIRIQFNNDTGNNYDYQAAVAYTSIDDFQVANAAYGYLGGLASASAPAGESSQISVDINNYDSDTLNKTVMSLNAHRVGTGTSNYRLITASSYWRSNAPITKIKLFLSAGNFANGTVVTLYGEKAINEADLGIEEAPIDGKQYARKDADWSEITSGSSGGVTDHTELTNIGINTHDEIDTALLRLANTSGSNTGDQDLSDYLTDASSDGKTYGRKNGQWSEIVTGSGVATTLDDLSDVNAGSPLDGQALIWDDNTGKWISSTITSGSGGGIEEAPTDGITYGRNSGSWVRAIPTVTPPVQTLGSAFNNASSRTLTLLSPVTPGNIIILASVSEGAVGITSVVMSGTNWERIASSGSSILPVAEMWKGTVISTGSIITVSYTGSSYCGFVVQEWSGITGTIKEVVTSSHKTTNIEDMPLLTTVAPNSLVIATAANSGYSAGFDAFNIMGGSLFWCVKQGASGRYAFAYGKPTSPPIGFWYNDNVGYISQIVANIT